jgi:DNA-binding NarL/FixJ family response regulator
MSELRIAIVSDDPILCDALLRIIQSDASLTALPMTGDALAHPRPRRLQPDVLLVDSQMPGMLAVCRQARDEGGAAVIFVAVGDDNAWVLDALSAGARGILYRRATAEDVLKAIHVVLSGDVWAPRDLLAAVWLRHVNASVVTRRTTEALLEQRLTLREREVLRCTASGLGNKEVAALLSISEATVKVHLTHIFRKLGLRSRGELAAACNGIALAAAAPAAS